MRKMLIAAVTAALVAPSALAGRRADPDDTPNMLTHGMAQLTLHVGVTTQEDVVTTFGAPNITTLDAQGQEVWIYDRQATVMNSGNSGFSIGMLVGGGGNRVAGGTGLGFGKSKSHLSETQRTMTLIIKFGADKKVVDFKSRSSAF